MHNSELFKRSGWAYIDKKNLGDQLNRALTSIPSNFEEGRGRGFHGPPTDEANFVHYALGSARESRVQIKIARSSNLIGETAHRNAVAILDKAITFAEARLGAIEDGKLKGQPTLGPEDDEPFE